MFKRSFHRWKRRGWRIHLLSAVTAAVYFAAASAASAQDANTSQNFSGDLATRPRLTGDWDGVRNTLARHGVTLDVDLLATPMDVVNGGRSTGAHTWGNVDYTLTVDTEKAGLWRGGQIMLSADTGLGSMNPKSGAIITLNTATLLPGPNEHATVLTNATLTQSVTDQLSLAVGKFNTFYQGEQEFYGNYSTQFLNGAFNFPVTTEQVPQSAFGGGVILQPSGNLNLSVYALDPSGTPDSNHLGEAFDDGVTVTGGATWTIHPFQLIGHQSLGFNWSNKDRLSLQQEPSNLAYLLVQNSFPRLGNAGPVLAQYIYRFFPSLVTPDLPANTRSTSWSVNYAFDQYVWQPAGDTTHGVGVFFSFGASDGNPNPVQYAYLAGIGGKGVGAARPDDSFGVGLARTQFSSAFIPFVRTELGLGLSHEDAFEAYYNFAAAQWLTITADLQVVDPALKKSLGSSGTSLVNVRTATVVGVRFQTRF
nr:carbohydrate porin [Dyella sp. ASV24]